MKISVSTDVEDYDVELIDVQTCRCDLPLATHHNEDTVAHNLIIILIEVEVLPLEPYLLSDAVFEGLNSHYGLVDSGCMRLHGWINEEGSVLSILWKDLSESYDSD